MSYPLPENEAERQRELDSFHILDSEPDEDFDRITRIAAQMLGMPIALVSLVDHDRQWFLSRVGLDAHETPREVAFCAHTICGDEVMVVEDARHDSRFHDNPLVKGDPHIRFYAGAPLRSREGHRLGTLCVVAPEPRRFKGSERQLLQDLAGMVIHHLEARRDRYLCPLTGLLNRRPFFESGQREFQRSLHPGDPLTLILFRLEGGAVHQPNAAAAWDQLLQETAGALRSELRESDLAARVGAAEFAALLGGREIEAGVELLERIRARTVRRGMVVEGARHTLDLRAGIASRALRDAGFQDFYRRAETALQQARLSGRDQMVAEELAGVELPMGPQQH